MEDIKIGKYIFYSIEDGRFYLSLEAQNTIYRTKGIICSYSGSSEWCNHFFCQMIDLYSGASPYNYSLGSTEHETRIPRITKQEEGRQRIVDWIKEQQSKIWWIKMVESFEFLFENLPSEDEQ